MADDPLDALDNLEQDQAPPIAPRPPDRMPSVPVDATEVTSSRELGGGQPGSSTDTNTQLLAMAFAFHPFTALFERLAVARYPRLKDKRACVERHVSNAPKLYRFCVAADASAVAAVVIIFLGTLTFGALKTLFGHF